MHCNFLLTAACFLLKKKLRYASVSDYLPDKRLEYHANVYIPHYCRKIVYCSLTKSINNKSNENYYMYFK